MRHIGQQLKDARERRGLSLQDVEQKTKIGTRYLQAIEEGQFDLIPGEVYLKGFIRSYARTVGVDGEALIEEYRAARGERREERLCAVPASRRKGLAYLWSLILGSSQRVG